MTRILAAALSILLVSCATEPTAADGTLLDGDLFVSVRIDGRERVLRSTGAGTAIPAADRRILFINGVGNDGSSRRLIAVSLALDSPEVGERIALGPGRRGTATLVMGHPQSPVSHTVTADSTFDGTATVTAYDPINRVVAGTFRFRGRLRIDTMGPDAVTHTWTDSIVAVEEGRFLVALD